MNIIVLCGGYSGERNVSFVSGGKVADALRSRGHAVVTLDPYESLPVYTCFAALLTDRESRTFVQSVSEIEPDLAALKAQSGNGEALIGENVLQTCTLADVVFVALHGSIGENGQIQAALDLYGVKYTGSGYLGCTLSMDKAVAKDIMAGYGVRVPTGEEIIFSGKPEAEISAYLSRRALPFVLKPSNGGSSVGISIVTTKEDIPAAVKYAMTYEGKAVVEDYVKGREFTVGILDGKALPVLEIIPKSGWFDYKNKYQAGATLEVCPAEIDDAAAACMQQQALLAHKALRMGDYSRVDFILRADGVPFCLEVNALPGMTATSLLPQEAAAAGIPYADLCEKCIQLALIRKRATDL
ncbi:MAG: D-alanine--D-alanine ligase [Oscillospiraceae bacterium]|jgi:D-alanine-D-alanine ligase|nr:D-alanine--D-alanine ligase [Oscillospiraceae bacterium]